MAVEVHGHVSDHETHIVRVRKNRLPALANRLPAAEHMPARMDTFGTLGLHPHGRHPGDIQTLKGPIKTLVGAFDLRQGFFLGCHNPLLFKTPPSRHTLLDGSINTEGHAGQGPQDNWGVSGMGTARVEVPEVPGGGGYPASMAGSVAVRSTQSAFRYV